MIFLWIEETGDILRLEQNFEGRSNKTLIKSHKTGGGAPYFGEGCMCG